MKKFASFLAIVLCVAILIQSMPLLALAASVSAEDAPRLTVDGAASDTPIADTIVTDSANAVTVNGEAFILGEIPEERTLDTKVFRMSDGSYTAAVYPTQIHYEENGEMKEIDYRCEEVTVGGEQFFETKAGPVSLRVPDTMDGENTVTFTSGAHSISFSLPIIEEIRAVTHESAVDTSRIESLRETIFAETLTDEGFEKLYSKAKAEAKVLKIDLSDAIDELSGLMMEAPGAASAVKYGSVMDGIDLNYSISGTI